MTTLQPTNTAQWLPTNAHHDSSIEKYFVGNGLYWRCMRYLRILCHAGV